MTYRYFFVLTLLSASVMLSQASLAQTFESERMSPSVYHTDSDSLTAKDLLPLFETDLFQSTDGLRKSGARDIYWVLLDFSEVARLTENVEMAAYFRGTDLATMYYPSGGEMQARNFGYLNSGKTYSYSVFDLHLLFNSNELIEGKYLLVKLQHLTSSRKMADYTVLVKTLDRLKTEQPSMDLGRLKNLTTTYVFTGVAGIVLLFALSAYFTLRRKEYIFYSLYLVALLVYFGRRAFLIQGFGVIGDSLLDYTMHMELQVLINLSYVLFARNFLNTRRHYPVLDKWIRLVVTGLVVFILADIALIWTGQFGIHFTAMNLQRYFMASFGILGSLYLVIRRKSPLVYFIVLGSLSYTIGALGTLFLSENDYMIVGSTIEIFIFTLGLGYKSLGLIRQNASIGQEVLQLEMKALRAQMNPHFIFNSLGSIQHLVRKDRNEEALQYLSRFSSLLRQILESAREGTVTVEEEAKLLKNYISLEALRFEGGFTYEVTVAPELDSHNLEIPILLVQPHVENAILHGLLPKAGEARLSIRFVDEGEYIGCIVEDNGIGREKSAALKSENRVTHKSQGLGIVRDRLDYLKGKTNDERLVQIDDIFDSQGLACGTIVTIRIPKES